MQVIVAIDEQFQDAEALVPYYRLQEAGKEVLLAGAQLKIYTGKHGYPLKADISFDRLMPDQIEALIIPGGWAPDKLRQNDHLLQLVNRLNETNKLIAAICHAGWVLSSADILAERSVTSYIGIRDDMINAGAVWKDEAVVIDSNLITSRIPADLPIFCKAIIEYLES